MTTPERYRVAFYFDCGSGHIATLTELCERVDSSLNWDYPPDPGPWRQAACDRFNADVAAAVERLRRELGAEWELTDEFQPLNEDPDLDRYLADPAGFRRQPRRDAERGADRGGADGAKTTGSSQSNTDTHR